MIKTADLAKAVDLKNPAENKPNGAPPEAVTIKDENIVFYEIEIAGPEFDPEKLTPEERAAIEAENEKVINDLKGYLIGLTLPRICNCHQPRIVQREMAKARLITQDGQPRLQYRQEDFDNYIYGVVLLSDHGVHGGVPLMVVIQCQTCHDLKFVGDIRPLMRHMGQVYMSHLDALRYPAGNMPGLVFDQSSDAPVETPAGAEGETPPQFIMENLETGEKTPADDLAQALFGAEAAGAAGQFSLEDVGKR